MTEVVNKVPARCRACPYFSDDIMIATTEGAVRDSIDEQRDSLFERGMQMEDIDLYLAHLDAEIELAKRRVESNLGRVAGCPGVDLSDFLASGEPVRFARCQSTLIPDYF